MYRIEMFQNKLVVVCADIHAGCKVIACNTAHMLQPSQQELTGQTITVTNVFTSDRGNIYTGKTSSNEVVALADYQVIMPVGELSPDATEYATVGNEYTDEMVSERWTNEDGDQDFYAVGYVPTSNQLKSPFIYIKGPCGHFH